MSDLFAGIAGHAAIKRILTHAVPHPHHAYLLVGGDGFGAHALAERFVRALLGMDSSETLLAHPDVAVLTRNADDGMKTQVPVERVRELRVRLSQRPVRASRMVAYLPDADRLNDAGANALLKVLEEPPAGAVFVLVASSAEGLPATIRSRVATLTLTPVADAEIDAFLSARGIADAERREAIRVARGRPGRALRHLEDADERVMRAERARTVDVLLRAPSAGHAVAALDAPVRAAEAGEDPSSAWESLLDGLMSALSDRFADEPQAAVRIGNALASARRTLGGPVSPRVSLELELVRMQT